MYALSDTGAYGCHALTVTGNTGQKSMGLYVGDGEYRKKPNIRFYADIVYTNTLLPVPTEDMAYLKVTGR